MSLSLRSSMPILIWESLFFYFAHTMVYCQSDHITSWLKTLQRLAPRCSTVKESLKSLTKSPTCVSYISCYALLHNSHPEGTLLCLQLLSQCQPFHASVTQHAAFPAGCTCFLFSCLPNLLILKIPINYRFQGNLSRASWQG